MLKQKVEQELQSRSISIVALMDALIEYAHTAGASDIHIDPTDKTVRIRFRIDGVLQDVWVR